MKHTFYYKTFKWNLIQGPLLLLIGIFNFYDKGFSHFLGYFFSITGILYLLPIMKFGKRRAITFMDDYLVVHNQQDIFNKKIRLADVKKIENRFIWVRVTTNEGKTYDMEKDHFEPEELKRLHHFIGELNLTAT